MACGNLSKAAARCTSTGLGDLSDPRVVEQLAAKHLPRRAPLPAFDAGDCPDYELDLAQLYRTLPRGSGAGPDGLFNEYLAALPRGYAEPRAARAMKCVDRFESWVANAKAPWWFYYVTAACRLVAPLKPGASAAVPDVRPLGLGGVRRRATARYVGELHREAFAAELGNVQVAVDMESGDQKLLFGIRAVSELKAEEGHVVGKIDKRNAYNQVKRERIL